MRIVVLTCDKYKWLVPVFLHFFNKNWPDNSCEIDIVADAENLEYKNVFYTNGVSWSTGIINYLKQSKDDKFLLTPEDYIIESKVDTARIKRAEKLCAGNVGCVRLNQPDKYFRFATQSEFRGFREYPLDKPYSMSMQAAIWQKSYLLDVLRDGEDAWQAEIEGSKRLAKIKGKWRILWTKSAIIDYQAGGFMVAGKPRMSVVKWVLSDMKKQFERG